MTRTTNTWSQWLKIVKNDPNSFSKDEIEQIKDLAKEELKEQYSEAKIIPFKKLQPLINIEEA